MRYLAGSAEGCKAYKRPPVFPEKGEQKVFLSDHIIIAVLRGLLIQEILQGDAA